VKGCRASRSRLQLSGVSYHSRLNGSTSLIGSKPAFIFARPDFVNVCSRCHRVDIQSLCRWSLAGKREQHIARVRRPNPAKRSSNRAVHFALSGPLTLYHQARSVCLIRIF
jgi:hypothetical protein